ncbi:unnamed protein product [Rotaria magnacalcarata]|uniref:Uncharacterized protein n=1 Tax=Rotaria magnacalcarata TaxID=392030 RepID=A0A820JDL5_9BILA|nr:unnamed protein product [Rotaria magnacalcarata]CAF2133075.1 unnamed protein product [Rotaria magnacalcarata]CAF4325257.1 unnamed protein product [Rotaria magnacalcarata]CAF4350170.1 unnamed protein product [Rotaria magnacalcarata]
MTTITSQRYGTFGTYSTVYTIYSIIFVGLILPSILGIFGYLTYRQMRQMHLRVQPMSKNTVLGNATMPRRDRELLIIVITEIFIYVISTTPTPINSS